MRRFILPLLFLYLPSVASALPRYNGLCQQGGQSVITSGLTGTPQVMASYPQCTITVFIAGTNTLATIFSDQGITPLPNPFTADGFGYFFFYVASGSRVDVNLSGTTMPGYTIGDIFLSDTSGGGGGGSISVNGVNVSNPNFLNTTNANFIVTGSNVTISLIGLPLLTSPNTFTAANTFNINPTFSGNPALSVSGSVTVGHCAGFLTATVLDDVGACSAGSLLASNNTWSGTNQFNANTGLAAITLYGTVFSTTPLTAGADMAAKISTTWAAITTANTGGGMNDSRAFNGVQNVSGSLFTGYTAASGFNGVLDLQNTQIVTSVTQTVPNGIIIQGNSGHPTNAPVNSNTGTTIQPANGFASSTPIWQFGNGSIESGIQLNNTRVSCISPNGTAVTGAIGVSIQWAQENSQINNLFGEGCHILVDLEGSNAQNFGPIHGLVHNMSNLNDATALAFQYGTTSAGSGPFRGLDSFTFGGGANAATPAALANIDGSNSSWTNGHLEQATVGFEVGANHGVHGLFMQNINLTGSVAHPMTTGIDLSSAVGSDGVCIFNVFSSGGNVTNLLVDHQTNGGTIAVATEPSLAFYCRGRNNTVLTSSSQIADTWPAHNENFSASTIKLPQGAGFTASATSNIGINTTNGAAKLWAGGVDSLSAFFPNSSPPAGGKAVLTTGVIGQLVESPASVNNAIIQTWCFGTASSSTTLFMEPFGTSSNNTCASGAGVAFVAPYAGTIKNLEVLAGTGGFNASSGVFTVNVNGSPTSVTCTVGTGTTCSDTVDTAAIAQGGSFTLKFTTQATETLANIRATFQIQ